MRLMQAASIEPTVASDLVRCEVDFMVFSKEKAGERQTRCGKRIPLGLMKMMMPWT
jgi:hypothetical protein